MSGVRERIGSLAQRLSDRLGRKFGHCRTCGKTTRSHCLGNGVQCHCCHEADEQVVATDGGQEASAYVIEEVELQIRGNRVHVQALLAVLSVASDQLSGSVLQPAADLAGSVPEQAVSLEDTIDTAHSMMKSNGKGWDDADPAEALDVEFVSVVDDQDDRDIMTDGGIDQSSNSTEQVRRKKELFSVFRDYIIIFHSWSNSGHSKFAITSSPEISFVSNSPSWFSHLGQRAFIWQSTPSDPDKVNTFPKCTGRTQNRQDSKKVWSLEMDTDHDGGVR